MPPRLLAAGIAALCACGDSGGSAFDGVAAIDAREASTAIDSGVVPLRDAAPPADANDASEPDLPPCPKPPVYVNALGGKYRPGLRENSMTNASTIVGAERWLFGPGTTRGVVIAGRVRDVLQPLGVRVTTTDPGDTPHVEVTLVVADWIFEEPAVAARFTCMVVPQPVAFVNMTDALLSDAQIAARVLYAVGTVVGLEPSSTPANCMNLASSACTFSAGAAVVGICGGATVQQQYERITAPLACF